MNAAQQSALEALMGRQLTLAEITAIDSLLDPNNRNDIAITDLINKGQVDIVGSIPVDDVFDVLYESGDYITLKSAQMAGNPVAALAFAALYDAKQIGKNAVNFALPTTIASLDQLEAAQLLSVAGRSALIARSTQKAIVKTVDEVSRALNIAENRMVM